jgi:glycosyltransferase involved in cell wall biosynthesis
MVKLHNAERLSLCICTFNRCKSLALTLESLIYQTFARDHNYELLIIDNNCNDETPRVVQNYAGRLPLRRIVEVEQGASHARNRAIAEFSGDVLLFTDDDVTLDPNWLAEYAIALKRYPHADIFGGRVVTAVQGGRPKWLIDYNLPLLNGVLVNFDHGEDLRPFTIAEPAPVTASCAVRRRVFEEVGNFRVDLGPLGPIPRKGEDTEFFDRSVKRGAKLIYVGGALCWHRVEANRLTLRALYQHGIEKGRVSALVDGHLKRRSLAEALLFIVRGLGQIAKGRGDRARQCVINAGMVIGSRMSSRAARRAV